MDSDVTNHVLVPKHTKLGPEEKEELLTRLQIAISQLPYILKADPAIRTLNAEVGDVIKIERKSPTMEKTMYYRMVVSG